MPQMQKVRIRIDYRFHIIGKSKSGHNDMPFRWDTTHIPHTCAIPLLKQQSKYRMDHISFFYYNINLNITHLFPPLNYF